MSEELERGSRKAAAGMAPQSDSPRRTRAWHRVAGTLVATMRGQPIWIFVVLIFVFFSIAPQTREFFFDLKNFTNILIQTTPIGIIALGMTLVMIDGEIDLSVGAIMALAASLAVGLQNNLGILPAVGLGLLAGIAIGAFNGLVVWKTGVDSFIVTLGGLLGVRGLVFVYTKEQSFFAMDFSYSDFGVSTIGPLPSLALIFLVLTALMHWLLTRTQHGRDTFAVGGNREAAVNAGIRVGPHLLINFVLIGFLAAVSGILLSTQMGASTPNMGTNFELWVITAVVLGGTKLTGGHGSILGTLGGVLAIQTLRNGMNLMQVPAFWVLVILGSILIAVLFIDKQASQRQSHEVMV